MLCRIYPVSHIECSMIGDKQKQTAYKLKYINMVLQEVKNKKNLYVMQHVSLFLGQLIWQGINNGIPLQ